MIKARSSAKYSRVASTETDREASQPRELVESSFASGTDVSDEAHSLLERDRPGSLDSVSSFHTPELLYIVNTQRPASGERAPTIFKRGGVSNLHAVRDIRSLRRLSKLGVRLLHLAWLMDRPETIR